jgi:hypothetical protein
VNRPERIAVETRTIPMIWRVEDYRGKLVQEFHNYYDAVDLVNSSERNLYIAEPSYRRPL